MAVIDEGVVSAPEALPYLFERLRQINREEMEQQGVVLGLTIARELVRFHGGEIAAESTPGKGTRFVIQLPPDEAPSKASQLTVTPELM